METIEIDGRMGEGGGQILRSALTLSMLCGKAVEMHHIRGKRPKPGLMRQHLTCVNAAREICQGRIEGAGLGSQQLRFIPGAIKGGDYRFDVGSAGSTTLVFETILLPLLLASDTSTVAFLGGTHNPMAPPLTYIKRSFLPLLRDMGAQVEINTERWGFMPVGGGKWQALIKPSQWHPIEKLERGDLVHSTLTAYEVGLPNRVAEREVKAYEKQSSIAVNDVRIRQPKAGSPGNLLAIDLQFENSSICLTELGRPRITSERVAADLRRQVELYLESGTVLDEHLADQMMLPMAMAGGGKFSCGELSQHAETNREVIRMFTGARINLDQGILRL